MRRGGNGNSPSTNHTKETKMIVFRGQLKRGENSTVTSILEEIPDIYSDFYITKNNLRLFIKENTDLLVECLKKGDKIVYSEEDGAIFVTGWSDKSPRKYVKILSKNERSADRLLKALLWNIDCELWIKIKKNNPILSILKRNNFRFIGNRGKEILLVRKPLNKKDNKPQGAEQC
jgi:hypothetical protein